MLKILVIDDDPIVRAALKRTLEKQGYDTTVASNGEEGIIQAQLLRPALIICDWMMSQLDGLEVCRRIKADSDLATTFFILLTAKGATPGEAEDRVRGLDAGADEFVSKPIEMNELKARVRAGLRLHQLNQDLQSQKQVLEILNQNLQAQKQILEAELAEAAHYVQSLLPPKLEGEVSVEALFIPSTQLGGDSFDYYWIDDENLAIYLLDVSGHGVGSALLSVSVLNVLRSQSLPNTDFCQPSEVLKALNHAFQMTNHGDKYFTMWYGVYNRLKRQLIYANAGHPPGVLLSGSSGTTIQVKQLGSLDLPIGFLPDVHFDDAAFEIEENSTLYIFSDGVYEINQPDGNMWGLDAFIDLLTNCSQENTRHLNQVLAHIVTLSSKANYDDDLSLLKVNFG
ncbi:SpoIIE family protein phosphatase [Nostoc sp. UHCC 0302]|uniref:PP2C family protein-serine/threonine phosphatase n=1 Tax=Nostoc sp. UHCC 0302 TaxID=3134896 RepID=UPI00311CA4D9